MIFTRKNDDQRFQGNFKEALSGTIIKCSARLQFKKIKYIKQHWNNTGHY